MADLSVLSASEPRRLNLPFCALLFFNLFVWTAAYAKEATVFDVRRPISMENGEVTEKDYFINAGENDGLKKGMVITVNRRQALYDQYLNKSPGDLIVPIGQLRIIHVQPEISVARLEKIQSRDNLPTLDFDAIMLGDKVDLSSAKMGSQKTASADVEVLIPVEVAVPVPASPQVSPSAPVAPVPKLDPNAKPGSGSAEFSSLAPQAPIPSTTQM